MSLEKVHKEEMWSRLVTVLAMVARHDSRPPVADAAAAALLGLLEAHGEQWEASVWEAAWQRGPAYVLDVPGLSEAPQPPSASPVMAAVIPLAFSPQSAFCS